MYPGTALALLKWAAEYYHHPIGEVMLTALPKGMRDGADAQAREEVWTLTPEVTFGMLRLIVPSGRSSWC